MPIYVVENDYSEEEPSSADSDDAETLQEWNKIFRLGRENALRPQIST